MSRSELQEFVFGSFDGMTSLVGLLGGLAISNPDSHTILRTCGGMAVASGIGMAFGDEESGATWRQAGVMGLATY